MQNSLPSYLKLSGAELLRIKEELSGDLKECKLCPRLCGVNRLNGKLGFCKTGLFALVNSFNLHFGEEKELVGESGSGTIFFSFCNLECVYCQNYTISHLGQGQELNPQDLALIMLKLQDRGAHNINFVTPTHVLAQIVEALVYARDKGLKTPLVYNSSGYDLAEVLKKIEGIFDIYMPDVKYSDGKAEKYSKGYDYWDVCKKALLEMYAQVGDLAVDNQGIAQRGLLIRHLVLPNNIAGSFKIIDFIVENISRNTYLNIMDQYRPCYKAYMYTELSRGITSQEYKEVLEYALERGLNRGFTLI